MEGNHLAAVTEQTMLQNIEKDFKRNFDVSQDLLTPLKHPETEGKTGGKEWQKESAEKKGYFLNKAGGGGEGDSQRGCCQHGASLHSLRKPIRSDSGLFM